MKKAIVIVLISSTIFSGAHALTINVKNNSDGQIQLIPAQLAQQAFQNISAMNPLAEGILGLVREQTNERTQQGLEASTTIYYGGGESGTTNLQFCPRTFKVKKLSGTGAGQEVSFRTPSCNNFKLEISNTPNGLGVSLPKE